MPKPIEFTDKELAFISKKVNGDLLTFMGHYAIGGLKENEIKYMKEFLEPLSKKLETADD